MQNFSSWRLIPLIQAPGDIQMALDAWLFEQHCLGLHPPTLWFYTWSPVAISLGYHQHHYPQAWHQLSCNGESVDLVRRPTGGRAVLHQGDLTYAVITSGMPTSRIEAYRAICEFLILGWRSLGVDLSYGQAGRGYIHNPNCFGTATGADLVLPNGAKLIGSAQLRRNSAVLQHGSIRLQTNPDLFHRVFGIPLDDFTLPFDQFDQSQLETIIGALTDSASHCFDMTLISQPLSDAEWQSVFLTAAARRSLMTPQS